MLLTGMAKTVATNVLTVLATLAVLAGGYWCWKHPETVKQAGGVLLAAGIWLASAAALPWSSFLFVRPMLRWQASLESTSVAHAASVGLIAAYSAANLLIAVALNGWRPWQGLLNWVVVILGLLAAAAYNFVICESLARRADV